MSCLLSRPPVRALCLLLALVAAGRCGPALRAGPQPPPVPAPAAAVADGTGGVALPPDVPLTLEACLALAQAHNRAVLAARARVSGAAARVGQVTASQLPTLAVAASDVRNDKPPSPVSGLRQDAQRLVINDNVQPFGRNLAQRRAALAGRDSADADALRVTQETMLAVTRAFYDLLLADELIAVASASVEQLTRHRDRTRDLLSAGTAARFDLLRAEVQLAAARPALIRARTSRANAVADLLHLLGVDPAAQPQVVGSFPASVPAELPRDEEAAVAAALAVRPDLAAARAAQEAARQQWQAARQALQPTLNLAGNLERARGSRAPAADYIQNWSVTAAFNFPFFDAGLARAQAREARANLDAAGLAADGARSAVRVEVRKALATLREAEEVLVSQELSVEQAAEALAIAQKAFGTGTMTGLDVLDAELALTRARTSWFQALRDRAVAVAGLEKALGRMPGSGLAAAPAPTAAPVEGNDR